MNQIEKQFELGDRHYEVTMSEEYYESVKVMCKRYNCSESYYFFEFALDLEIDGTLLW